MFAQTRHTVAVAVQAAHERLGEHAAQLDGVHGARVLPGRGERVQLGVVVPRHW